MPYQNAIYIYGTKSDSTGAKAVVHVAKAELVDNKLTNFVYWDGAGWQSDATKTAKLEGLQKNISEQFNVFSLNEKIVLVSQNRSGNAKEIYSYIADSPEGAFSHEKLLYTVDEPNFEKDSMMTYNTMVHPQYMKNDKILMCYNVNTYDLKKVFEKAASEEKSPLGRQILGQLEENLKIAGNDMIPICQDTGMAVVFVKVGQEVHIEGGSLTDAINEGVRQGYVEGYLRKSVVKDPIERENTKDNTPAVIHYDIVPGDKVDIIIAPKGFGSENMSRVFMLKPADGIEGVKDAILTAVRDAGPNACPPMVVGVGIGGTFEKCALLAKKALTRNLDEERPTGYVRELEDEMLEKINSLGIGPGGLGGSKTALAVNVETYPTHIAGLPVAVNICCHVNRHVHRVI